MLEVIEASELKKDDMLFIDNQLHRIMKVDVHYDSTTGNYIDIEYSYLRNTATFSLYANLLVWKKEI